MKIFMKNVPENYTPAKPMTPCGMNAGKHFGCAAKKFASNPTGLGMNSLEEIMDMIFSNKNNEIGKGVEIERIGDESKEKEVLDPFLKLFA